MIMKENTSHSGGIGFTGLLTILFIGLKLGHVIKWPWVWVLAPLWIGVAVFLILVLIAMLFAVGIALLDKSLK